MTLILAVWFLALFLGPPIYAALGLAAAAFIALHGFPGLVIPQKVAMAANSFPLLAAPFFILMGNVMNQAGITRRIFAFAGVLVGWLRGGLCHANIVASVIFAGMSGSALPMPLGSARSRSRLCAMPATTPRPQARSPARTVPRPAGRPPARAVRRSSP
jgi:hypothetical protein